LVPRSVVGCAGEVRSWDDMLRWRSRSCSRGFGRAGSVGNTLRPIANTCRVHRWLVQRHVGSGRRVRGRRHCLHRPPEGGGTGPVVVKAAWVGSFVAPFHGHRGPRRARPVGRCGPCLTFPEVCPMRSSEPTWPALPRSRSSATRAPRPPLDRAILRGPSYGPACAISELVGLSLADVDSRPACCAPSARARRNASCPSAAMRPNALLAWLDDGGRRAGAPSAGLGAATRGPAVEHARAVGLSRQGAWGSGAQGG